MPILRKPANGWIRSTPCSAVPAERAPSTYASAAEIFEVGFQHFFQARSDTHGGDLVYFQPHSAPGVYARAYLEGRLSENHLAHYRQEIAGGGLCSYPHPWLMPEFWQFPTGSMGLGPISAVYQALFTGAGWNVIKVLWGSDWDALFARDTEHTLLRRFASTPDGEYQTLGAKDGAYNLANFFQQDPKLAKLVAHMSDAEIDALKRGGHDMRKLHAAFAAAKAHRGRPTVILAKTKKGYGMGGAGESRMTAHQAKKLDVDGLKAFRDRFQLPLADEDCASLHFYRPAEDSIELRYLRERREALGGYLPVRRTKADAVAIPAIDSYAAFALTADGKEMSTTMAAVRMLGGLLKDRQLGPRIVPIVADEARTFGMANLFRQVGIYAPLGQLYEPEDAASMLSYREATDGQLLEAGINEAGALASWTAAATSYSVSGLAMLPVYIYYSMFGFQRVGDLIWAAADQRARGFLLGATADRTTLGGEGLQHQDGSSLLVASTVPNCRAYDPAFACELAVIVDFGARQMLEQQVDAFYYLTVMNENYAQPSLLAGAEGDIIKGLYRYGGHAPIGATAKLRLLGSGAILREVIAAAAMLAEHWGVASDIHSVTSYSELARDAADVERWNRLHPTEPARSSHVAGQLAGSTVTVAASDYVRALPQLIAPFVPGRYLTLGTDGFGRSDTRAALRRFFEVDAQAIVIASLDALARDGQLDATVVAEAIGRYGIDPEAASPWTR
jgi:pyruvate dehydrogenase E1 component